MGIGTQSAALLDETDLRGSVTTLDALHTIRDLERTLVDIHRTDCLLTIKGPCHDCACFPVRIISQPDCILKASMK